MKTVRTIVVALAVVGVLLGLTTFTTFAADPPGSSPATALYIDNVSHTIPGKTMQYYRFEYAGDNSSIRIMLVNGANSSVAFNVYTPEQINETLWWLLPPMGRGTAPGCGSQPADSDIAKNCRPFANDLVWVGKFYTPGAYFVEVQNLSEQPQPFTLTIQGISVRLCPVSPQPCPPMTLIPNE
ncbi:MAG: hypothetical protein HY741_01020 [Chloroflexi bacterium]|nr:hypothetical protein [Chloroflexota bacterium]